MARIRSLKPQLPQDVDLAECSIEARYTFILLITQADDYGCVPASPRALVGALYPHDLDITPVEVGEWIQELVDGGHCQWRWTKDGSPVVELTKFAKHQRIDNRGKQTFNLDEERRDAPDFSRGVQIRSKPRRTSRRLAEDRGAEDRGGSPRLAEVRGESPRIRGNPPLEGEREGEREREREQQLAREGARGEPGAAGEAFDRLRIALTVAANQAITAKWGEQVTPMLAGNGYSFEFARHVVDRQIPEAVAIAAIQETLERRPVHQKPPRVMTYFVEAVDDAWARQNDPAVRGAAVTVRAPMPLDPAELWRLVDEMGLHTLPFEQRDAKINSWALMGRVPDEKAFREAWGMLHVSAGQLVKGARDTNGIVGAFRAKLATGKQEPYPPHLNTLPHPWLDWPEGGAKAAEVAA